MVGVKITAHMQNGVAASLRAEGLPLDGSLLFAVVLEEQGDAFFAHSPSEADIAEETAVPHPRMPLEVEGRGSPDWFYRISLGIPEGSSRVVETHHWHKRFEELAAHALTQEGKVDMAGKRKVQTGSGEFRAYRMPIEVEVVERVVWWAHGDAAEIERLLVSHVHALGKKRNAGWGQVAAWQVEEDPDGLHMWRRSGGMVTRRIPRSCAGPEDGGDIDIGAIRPPYWCTSHWRECVVPPHMEE